MSWTGERVRLFVGDDWAEDHHDVELMDVAGRVLAKRRLPEGVAGMARLHEMVGLQAGEDPDDAEVVVGIETDRGPWVLALVAAGYTVYGVNPLLASRYRERHGVSSAKSNAGDAHMLADMVRTDSHQLRAVAGDSAEAEGVKVLARTHKTLIWERTRHVQRLRHQLRGVLPRRAGGLRRPGRPRHPRAARQGAGAARAARLTRAQVSAALKRARRRNIADKATAILAALRSPQLGQPPAVTAAYAATVRSLIAVNTVLNEQVKALQGQVEEHFGQHPDAEVTGPARHGRVLGARVLSRVRRRPARVRRREGPQELRRHQPYHPRVREEEGRRRPLHPQRPARRRPERPGLACLNASPGARAFYDQQRAKGIEHNDALRRLANRLVGILHGCLKTRTLYDEATAGPTGKTSLNLR